MAPLRVIIRRVQSMSPNRNASISPRRMPVSRTAIAVEKMMQRDPRGDIYRESRILAPAPIQHRPRRWPLNTSRQGGTRNPKRLVRLQAGVEFPDRSGAGELVELVLQQPAALSRPDQHK